MSDRKFKYLRVKAVHHYIIEGERSESDLKRLADEWFINYPFDSYHAARDGSKLGGGSFAYEVEEVTSEEMNELLEKHYNGANNMEYDNLPEYYYPKEDEWELEEHSVLSKPENTK